MNASEAANILWKLWNKGEVIDALPDNLRPKSRNEGYIIQAALGNYSPEPNFGWKVAATSRAGQQHIGVSRPIAGRLLKERVFENGSTLVIGANRMRVAEPEFAFRLGMPLEPREKPYELAEVVEAVESLHPAIEVPDSRFENFTIAGEAQLIADNACGHEFVLGPPTDIDWRSVELSKHEVMVISIGGQKYTGLGANVLGDPYIALQWLVNEVTGLGMTIDANQVVTTGTCATPLDIKPDDEVKMDFGILGKVEVVFSE